MGAMASRVYDRVAKRLKVVHVIVAGDIGGAERLLVDLALRPAQSGADHCVALMTPNPQLREMISAAGVMIRDRGPVRENPFAYLWRSFGPADVAWLEHILTDEGASVVHVHTYGSHILGVRAALRRRLPVLRTEHGIHHYRDPSCSLFRRWALQKTDCVVAVSAYVGRFVEKAAPYARSKLRVIRNGVDATYFHAEEPPGEGPFTFALVCRLEPWKRIDLVMRAVARVPQIRLQIAGDGSARRKLQALARELRVDDRVSFLGYRRDPRPVIAQSHAAINSSRDEPLGLSVLEALAMQRPVVAFAGGGIPEIVQDGRTGWLVRESSVEALAARLFEASADRRRAAALGANGRAFIDQECRIEDMCRGYARAYLELDENARSATSNAAARHAGCVHQPHSQDSTSSQRNRPIH
jgi:glycosyltransferase involved in cell wall biosynthesis